MSQKVRLKATTPFGKIGDEIVLDDEIIASYGEEYFESAEGSDTEKTEENHTGVDGETGGNDQEPESSDSNSETTKPDTENAEETAEKTGVLGKIFGNGKNKAILEPKSTK